MQTQYDALPEKSPPSIIYRSQDYYSASDRADSIVPTQIPPRRIVPILPTGLNPCYFQLASRVPLPTVQRPLEPCVQEQESLMSEQKLGEIIFFEGRHSIKNMSVKLIPDRYQEGKRMYAWNLAEQFFLLELVRNLGFNWGAIAEKFKNNSKYKIKRSKGTCTSHFTNIWNPILPETFYLNGVVKIEVFKNHIKVSQKVSGLWEHFKTRKYNTSNTTYTDFDTNLEPRNRNKRKQITTKAHQADPKKQRSDQLNTITPRPPPMPYEAKPTQPPSQTFIPKSNEDSFVTGMETLEFNFDIFDIQLPASPGEFPLF